MGSHRPQGDPNAATGTRRLGGDPQEPPQARARDCHPTWEGGRWDAPNLPSNTASPADLKLQEVYGDYVHQNPGTHLTRGILDDAVWQDRWRRLPALPTSRYNCLDEAVGKNFITMMSVLWEGIMEAKHNAKKPMVFMAVILQKCRTVKKAKDVRCRVDQRLLRF